MGDVRYQPHLEHILREGGRAVSDLSDDEVVQALAALAGRKDAEAPYLANVLASEAMNRLGRARAALLHLAEGVVAVDSEGLCTLANPEAERLLGWSASQLRGSALDALVHDVHEGCAIRRALEGETVRDARERLIDREGRAMDCAMTVAPVVREGERAGAVLLLRRVEAETSRNPLR